MIVGKNASECSPTKMLTFLAMSSIVCLFLGHFYFDVLISGHNHSALQSHNHSAKLIFDVKHDILALENIVMTKSLLYFSLSDKFYFHRLN